MYITVKIVRAVFEKFEVFQKGRRRKKNEFTAAIVLRNKFRVLKSVTNKTLKIFFES